MMNDDKKEMVRIWKSLRQTGECEGFSISPDIRESWDRSDKLGVNPFKPCCDVILSVTELEERKADNSSLLEQASVMMGHLHRFTESGFVFTLADNEGYLLKRMGDRQALDFSGAANLTEGADWSEKVMGTNSVGMALTLRRPVQVFGYEHYCLCASVSTCAASPIFDGEGHLIGVLNITGPYRWSIDIPWAWPWLLREP
jgi:transcriptional regulator of acetoin/glycerol metabolism